MIRCRYERLNDEGEYRPRTECRVAAAVLGAGALGAGASYFGSKSAADAQVAAQQQAMALQREMFGKAENALSPFINMGQGGIENLLNWYNPNAGSGSPLEALMKLTMPGADMSDTLAQTPGYQFAENRGLKAVDNALAKRGLAGSGGAVSKGAADFVTGLAGNTWQNVVNALSGTLTSGGNALANIVGQGAGSAQALAGNALGAGQGMANTASNIGNAQAGGIMGQANALGNFGNTLGQYGMIQSLLGGGMGYGNMPGQWNPNVPGGVYSGTMTG